MAANFDHWVVVEGFAKIRHIGRGQVVLPSSTDGTIEFMKEFSKANDNVTFYSHSRPFKSKDEQTNKAVMLLKRHFNQAYLWQVDVDEQWNSEDLSKAEQILTDSRRKQASFQFNHFVGDGIIAVGDWGSDFVNRLFIWRGQRFITHIPARMYSNNLTLKIEGIKYNHYSYIFAEDVQFKEDRYIGYKGLKDKWDELQSVDKFPVPISTLFPDTCEVSKGNTQIIRI